MARPSPRTNADDTPSSKSTGKLNLDLEAALDTTQSPASQDDKRKAHRPVLARIIGGVRRSPKKRRPSMHLSPVKELPDSTKPEDPESLDIRLIGAAPFAHFARQKGEYFR